MPCELDGDADVPTAYFGTSNVGRMKTRLSRGPAQPLRRADAGHLRRALQLLVPDPLLGGVRPPPRNGAKAARRSSRRATSTCCATTAATAGSCCICSASRRRCGRSFLGDDAAGLETLDARHALRPARHLAAHERRRLSQPQPGGDQRLGQQPRGIRARPAPCDPHAASALRSRWASSATANAGCS